MEATPGHCRSAAGGLQLDSGHEWEHRKSLSEGEERNEKEREREDVINIDSKIVLIIPPIGIHHFYC